MPQKTFSDNISENTTMNQHIRLPEDFSVMDGLNRVLRLLSVGSKRFLTTKVDRSVTGLVARQQCSGID